MESKNYAVNHELKWGDIYTCDLGKNNGSVQGGVRPVLIVQDTVMNINSPTVMVVAITSVLKKTYMKAHVVLSEECGLRKKSMVMMEQVHTVNKYKDLKRYVGHISKKDVKAVKDALAFTLDTDKEEGIVLTLCPRCRSEIMNDTNRIIRRIHNRNEFKDTCDLCQMRKGYEYLIANKRGTK